MEWCLKHLASIPIYLAMEGDVSFFDWQPNGLPDHVGFVDERSNADYFYTIEGNTSGGIVARRKRSDKEEQLTFRLHYTPTAYSADKQLEVDGIYGYSSIAVTQKWLMQHCWEYGFILRYPKDKTAVTGIIYEPWHYRYVGKEAAEEITKKGICLEEYLAVSQ